MKTPTTAIARPEKFRPVESILKDEKQRAKLTNLVDEALKCRSKIDFEKDNIKALRETAVTELGLKPKLFNAYVAAVYSNDYVDRKAGLEEQLTLLERIMQIQGIELNDNKDDE
jgi:hypothetical protein